MRSGDVAPLGVRRSVPYFAVPALALIGSVHWLMPWLHRSGLGHYWAYLVAVGLPLLGLLIASFVALRLETGSSTDRAAIATRLRLGKMQRDDWVGVAVTVLVVGPASLLVARFVTRPLIDSGWIPLPAGLPPFLDPRVVDQRAALELATGGLEGNWALLGGVVVVHIVNVVGEELWWRGVILPRQELASGPRAWLIHGAMWALFHAYKFWDLLTLLPLALAIPWVASRRQNTTPGLVSHFVTNGTGLVVFAGGALGLS